MEYPSHQSQLVTPPHSKTVLASPSFLISLNVQDLVVSSGQKNLDLSINQYNANEYRLGVASPFCHFFN